MVKKKKIWIGLGAFLIVLAMIPYGYGLIRYIGNIGPIFKVTNPDSRFFNSAEFNLDDYGTEEKLQNALEKIFPVGTSRENVEGILMDNAGFVSTYVNGNNGSYFIIYSNPSENLDNLTLLNSGINEACIEYDLQDTVRTIRSHIISSKVPPKFFRGQPINKGEKL